MKFGTDGIRGLAYSEITSDIAYKLGNAFCAIQEGARVLVGRDTRSSSLYLEEGLAKGIVEGGGVVLSLGVAPTPCVEFLLEKYTCDFGVVITASHNPQEYNGLKVFVNGGKLSETAEKQIEAFLNDNLSVCGQGWYEPTDGWSDTYIDFLVSNGKDLTGKKILIDCANGSFSHLANKAFIKLGALVTIICEDGVINDNCGALYAQNLKDKVLDGGYDFAFAFDGDGDRLISVDERGEIFDGDDALYALAVDLKEKGQLSANVAVGTIMTNTGVELALADKGIKLIRTNVGDKYILRELEKGYSLGGEQSGHTIIYDVLKTGDGALTAIKLASICASKKLPLSLLSNVVRFEQKNFSFELPEKILEDKDYNLFINSIKCDLKDGRIVVRKSGTEKKIRFMLEGREKKIVDDCYTKIVNFVCIYLKNH